MNLNLNYFKQLITDVRLYRKLLEQKVRWGGTPECTNLFLQSSLAHGRVMGDMAGFLEVWENRAVTQNNRGWNCMSQSADNQNNSNGILIGELLPRHSWPITWQKVSFREMIGRPWTDGTNYLECDRDKDGLIDINQKFEEKCDFFRCFVCLCSQTVVLLHYKKDK